MSAVFQSFYGKGAWLPLKLCVGKSVSEAVTYRNIEGVKIAVPYVYAFFIFFSVYIAALVAEIGCVGIIVIGKSPCVCHLSRRRNLSAEYVGKGIPSFLSGLHKL